MSYAFAKSKNINISDTNEVCEVSKTMGICSLLTECPYFVWSEEARLDANNTALVPITRAYGSFGTVSVDWVLLEPSAGEDLAPLGGTVVFLPGMSSSDIELNVLPDGVSSIFVMHFFVHLYRLSRSLR